MTMKTIQALSLAAFVMLLAAFNGCEIFEDYEEDKEWVMTDLDQSACDRLNDSLFVLLSTKWVADLRPKWVDAADSIVIQTFDSLIAGTNTRISFPEANDTSYAFFANASADSGWVMVLNDHVKVAFIMKDSTVIQNKADHIPLETVAACDTIKTRLEFDLAQGNYLMRLIVTESTLAGTYVEGKLQRLQGVILHAQ